ncbi:MAG: DUF3341 domain-containing protein [Variovorax sp.]|nr:DUF3341 domain-containing protein [Variovorax sp.]
MAEFDSADRLLAAARSLRTAGFRGLQAYAPFDVPGLAEVLQSKPRGIAFACLLGSLAGGFGGFFMQWWAVARSYPVDIGGRPANSWPMFVPVCFSLAVLGGAFFTLAAMLWRARLPKLYHPIFDAPDFARAARDRFFVVVRSDDAAFEATRVRQALDALRPLAISEVTA